MPPDTSVSSWPIKTPRFPEHERKRLLIQPGIGPKVVERIEAIGITSLDELAKQGADEVVLRICNAVGQIAWANRRLAITNALKAVHC